MTNGALLDASPSITAVTTRGAYVLLKPNGVSLWVSALDDDKPLVKVREPVAGGLMERIIFTYLDSVDGVREVTGVGANPHINAQGRSR